MRAILMGFAQKGSTEVPPLTQINDMSVDDLFRWFAARGLIRSLLKNPSV